MINLWNAWHGCHKISAGCQNCYMFRRDAKYGKDSTVVTKTANFRLPVMKKKDGSFKLQTNDYVYTCMTSDFFVEEADDWRSSAWEMIKLRSDLKFFIITKRRDRFDKCKPYDWKDGYDNVTICSTCENQEMADYRLPIMIELPIKHMEIIHEPMLEAIDINKYLESGKIEQVTCGGESGDNARELNYDWVLSIREQCKKWEVPFYFKQTGAKFIKNGKVYKVPRAIQMEQARKANIDL